MTIVQFNKYTALNNGNRCIKEARAELEREIAVRRKIFDRWVQEEKMSWMDAHDRLERILSALRWLIAFETRLDQEHAQNNNAPTVIESESAFSSLDTAPAEQAA